MMRYIKKPKQTNGNYVIVYDHREVGEGKEPWLWLEHTHGAMEKVYLETGDYSFKGCEKVFTIDRKSGILELFRDLTGSYRSTFFRFLKRASKYPIKAIVVEEQLTHARVKSVLQKLRHKSNGRCQLNERTIYVHLAQIMLHYGIPILFVDKQTERHVIRQLFDTARDSVKELK